MIQLTQGNYGHKVNINIKNKDGKPIKLDGCAVTIDLVFVAAKTKKQYDLTILDSDNGRVQLTITPDISEKLGKVLGFIDVTNPTSQITLNEALLFYTKPSNGGLV